MDFQRQGYLTILNEQGKQIGADLLAGDYQAQRIIQLYLQVKRDQDEITWGLLMSAIDDWKARHES